MPITKHTRSKNFKRTRLAAASIAAVVVTGGAATALAAEVAPGDLDLGGDSPVESAAFRGEYKAVYQRAKKLDIEPKRNLALVEPNAPDLNAKADVLRIRVAGERGVQKIEEKAEPDFATPESLGVDQATLDSIASCESGGDPTAVDPSGTYYGKYQFDYGTWASMGGSGNPAAASEEEQDFRAASLYAQAGASPWPVCGS